MTNAQVVTLTIAFLVAAAILYFGTRRPPRRLDATVAMPRAPIRPQDVPLRDAAYLVRRHLDGLPTSRRKSGLGDQAWRRAMSLLRTAEIVDSKGRWAFEDYPSALAMLQRAYRTRAELMRRGNFVDPVGD